LNRTIAVVAVCLMTLCAGGSRAGESEPIQAGSSIPADLNLSVVDLQGGMLDLRKMLAPQRADARASLLVFWATWCAPCIHEIPVLRSLQDFHRDRGLRIVGVGVREGGESPERIAEAAKRHKLNYDIVFDREGQVQEAFGLIGIPWSVLIDGEGIVQWAGPALPRDIDGRIRSALKPQEERGSR